MKNPYTPIESRQYQRKNSFAIFIFHEEKTPVKTIIDESISIATEIPSTPTVKDMLSGAYQLQLEMKSISAIGSIARSLKNNITNTIESASNAVAPATIIDLIVFMLLVKNNKPIIKIGINTNNSNIFIINYFLKK
jgi:hypothetical protein